MTLYDLSPVIPTLKEILGIMTGSRASNQTPSLLASSNSRDRSPEVMSMAHSALLELLTAFISKSTYRRDK